MADTTPEDERFRSATIVFYLQFRIGGFQIIFAVERREFRIVHFATSSSPTAAKIRRGGETLSVEDKETVTNTRTCPCKRTERDGG